MRFVVVVAFLVSLSSMHPRKLLDTAPALLYRVRLLYYYTCRISASRMLLPYYITSAYPEPPAVV